MSDPLADLAAAEERGMAAQRECEDTLIAAVDREERLAGIDRRAKTTDEMANRIPALRTREVR